MLKSFMERPSKMCYEKCFSKPVSYIIAVLWLSGIQCISFCGVFYSFNDVFYSFSGIFYSFSGVFYSFISIFYFYSGVFCLLVVLPILLVVFLFFQWCFLFFQWYFPFFQWCFLVSTQMYLIHQQCSETVNMKMCFSIGAIHEEKSSQHCVLGILLPSQNISFSKISCHTVFLVVRQQV